MSRQEAIERRVIEIWRTDPAVQIVVWVMMAVMFLAVFATLWSALNGGVSI